MIDLLATTLAQGTDAAAHPRVTAQLIGEYSDAIMALLIFLVSGFVAIVWRAAKWQARLDEMEGVKKQLATLQTESKQNHGRLCTLEGEHQTGPHPKG